MAGPVTNTPIWANTTLGFGDPSVTTPPLNYVPSRSAHLFLFVKGSGIPTITGYTMADSHVGGDGLTYSLWYRFVPWYENPHTINVTLSGNWLILANAINCLNRDNPISKLSWGSGTSSPVINTPDQPAHTVQLFYGSVASATAATVVGGDTNGTATYSKPATGSLSAYMPGSLNTTNKWSLNMASNQTVTWNTALDASLTVELQARNDSPFVQGAGTAISAYEPQVVEGSLAKTPYPGDQVHSYLDEATTGAAIDATHALFITGVFTGSNYDAVRGDLNKQVNLSAQVVDISSGKAAQVATATRQLCDLPVLVNEYTSGYANSYQPVYRLGKVVKAPDGTLLVPFKTIYRQTNTTARKTFTDLTDFHNYLQTLTEPFTDIGVIPITWDGTTLTINAPVVLHHYTFITDFTHGYFLDSTPPSIAVTASGAVIFTSSDPFTGVDGWYQLTSGNPDITKPYAWNLAAASNILIDKLTISAGTVSIASSATTPNTVVRKKQAYYQSFWMGSCAIGTNSVMVAIPTSSAVATDYDGVLIISDTLTTSGITSTGKVITSPLSGGMFDIVPTPDGSRGVLTNARKYYSIDQAGSATSVTMLAYRLNDPMASVMGHGPQMTSEGLWVLPSGGTTSFLEVHDMASGSRYVDPYPISNPLMYGGENFPVPLCLVLLNNRYILVLCSESDNTALNVTAAYIVDMRARKLTSAAQPALLSTVNPKVVNTTKLNVAFSKANTGFTVQYPSLGVPGNNIAASVALDTTHAAFIQMYVDQTNEGTPSVTKQYGMQATILSLDASGNPSAAGSAVSAHLFTFGSYYYDPTNSKVSPYFSQGTVMDLGSGLFAIPYTWFCWYGPALANNLKASAYEAGVIFFSWDGSNITFYPPSVVRSYDNTAGTTGINKVMDYEHSAALALFSDGTLLFGMVNPDGTTAPAGQGFPVSGNPFLVDKLTVDRTNHTVSVVGSTQVPTAEWVIGWSAYAGVVNDVAVFSQSNKYFTIDKNLNVLQAETFIQGQAHTQYGHAAAGMVKVPGKDYVLSLRVMFDVSFSLILTPIFSDGHCGKPILYTGTGINWYYPVMPDAATSDGLLLMPTSAYQFTADDGFTGGYSYDGWPYHQVHMLMADGTTPTGSPLAVANDTISNKQSGNTPDDWSYTLVNDRFMVVCQLTNQVAGYYYQSGDYYVIDLRG